jgi:hypothetical protein
VVVIVGVVKDVPLNGVEEKSGNPRAGLRRFAADALVPAIFRLAARPGSIH